MYCKIKEICEESKANLCEKVENKMTIIVIGLGSMGRRRIRLMKAMKLPIKIIGIDSKPERCEAVRNQFSLKCYESFEKAFEQELIDCAFICTSPLAHADLIRLCLLHGLHVFTEINLISDGYDENIALARERGLTLFLSSTPVYRDEMKEVMEHVKRSGKPVAYLYHVGQYLPDWHPWEKYTDFFIGDQRTNGCRELLAIELPWMMKTFGEIQDVHVLTNRLTNLNINFQDTYLVQIMHANGNQGMLAVDVVCRKPVRKLEVYNEELYLEWEGTPHTLKKLNLKTNRMEHIGCGTYYNEEGYSEFINEYAYISEINDFFDVVNGKQPEYTMETDARILKIIDRIEEVSLS